MAHSQVCERNSAQPSRSSVSIPGPFSPRAGARLPRMASISGTVPIMPDAAQGQRPARAGHGDEQPAGRGAHHLPGVHDQPADRAGLLQQRAGHQLGEQRLRGGVEQRGARAGQRLERDHRPQRRLAGQHEQPEDALARRDGEVRRDDHALRREAVRDDAADEGEHQRGGDLRGQDVGEVGGGAGDVQDRERDADQREAHGRTARAAGRPAGAGSHGWRALGTGGQARATT